MKILFFIESLGSGGKERRLVELIKNLSTSAKYEMEIVLTKNNIHYEAIFNTDIKIHYIIRKGLKKDPRLFYKFYKIAKKFSPDVIHVWGNLVAFYAIPTKVLLNKPMFNNQITDAPTVIKDSLIGPKVNFKFSDKIIANSFAGLKAYNAPKKKSLVIYNGFDFSRISTLESKEKVRDKLTINTEKLVTMVATYSDKKDHDTYINVAKSILDNRKDVTFLAVGGGNKAKYEALIKGYEDNIKLLGRHTNVESIMNASNFGVLCTYTEGISNALLEFMSLEKTVIITGAGGCEELVEHNKSGYLFNQGDEKSLRNTINKLLNDDELVYKFGLRSKKIVQEKFGIEKMMNHYKELYETINK